MELDKQGIKETIGEYVSAAKMAIEAGFDGVEIHGGNGYLLEQFLNDNINKRCDDYGGSPENRCRFPLELMSALANAIAGDKCAIRLSPFGLFNQTRGSQRVETWSYLCRELKKTVPDLSYVHFIEPRYEQLHSYSEKDEFIKAWGLDPGHINLDTFRDIMGDTPFITAGGWNHDNSWGVLESGKYDAIAYGRYFLSTPDFIARMREEKPMNKYKRERFYGPFPDDREVGYTDYPYYSQIDASRQISRSSLVAGGLLWWHAFLAVLVGHGIASVITVWNGRSGATYHINFPTMIRATFGIRGAYFPVFVRIVLDLVWFAVQSYLGGEFFDIMFQCIFGHYWTDIPNHLPASSDTTTRSMAAYFLFWLFQMSVTFFRPHEMKPLYYFKAVTMPLATFGLFIWCIIRSGGPGTIAFGGQASSASVLGCTFMAAMNSAINGEFGPLIASEPDITRYAMHNRDQVVGQLLVAPWSATLVALLGIIAAACTQKIYGEAYWQPSLILDAILAENNSPKTKFAVFLCSFVFVVGLVGTNYVSNLLPFGVDATIMAPRHLNFVRATVLCAIVGGWCLVPWKIMTSGATFLTEITGIGIFMSTLVGIMLADYFFIRKGNYWISDLYTSNPNGRYWYTGGFHWRAYVAYVCGIALPFPGFLGSLGVKGAKNHMGAAYHIYDIGYLTAFVVSMTVYTTVCKLSPSSNIAEARALPFEYQARDLEGEILEGQDIPVEGDAQKEMSMKDIEAKA